MSDREQILAALRKHVPAAVARPSADGEWIVYEDPVRQFVDVLEGVGGQAIVCDDRATARTALSDVAAFQQAARICSTLPEITEANVDLQAIDDPHRLADVDFAVLGGELAVAENGAVWVDTAPLRHRVLPFLAQHLALIVPANRIYHNLHQAYAALEFTRPGFGVFISGPSKTADIEQSLVIGAHGPRSLTVLLVGEAD